MTSKQGIRPGLALIFVLFGGLIILVAIEGMPMPFAPQRWRIPIWVRIKEALPLMIYFLGGIGACFCRRMEFRWIFAGICHLIPLLIWVQKVTYADELMGFFMSVCLLYAPFGCIWWRLLNVGRADAA